MDSNTNRAADGNDRCTYCGAEVPAPVELHHHESECRKSTRDLYVVFDGPPSNESGRFVELEDAEGIGVGGVAEWEQRKDGYWTLGPFHAPAKSLSIGEREALLRLIAKERDDAQSFSEAEFWVALSEKLAVPR